MVGMNVQRVYLDSNVTMQDIASYMGVDFYKVDDYFIAETLPFETLESLAKVLRVNVSELTRQYYTLILTQDERKSLDDIYGAGYGLDQINDILGDCLRYDDEWDEEGDLTFYISESQAWEMRELDEQEDCYTCFGNRGLISKLSEFLATVV